MPISGGPVPASGGDRGRDAGIIERATARRMRQAQEVPDRRQAGEARGSSSLNRRGSAYPSPVWRSALTGSRSGGLMLS